MLVASDLDYVFEITSYVYHSLAPIRAINIRNWISSVNYHVYYCSVSCSVALAPPVDRSAFM